MVGPVDDNVNMKWLNDRSALQCDTIIHLDVIHATIFNHVSHLNVAYVI